MNARSDLFERAGSIGAADVAMREGLSLKRRGSRSWTCCPIHKERTPSLMFDERGGWHCFGCGAGGSDGASFLAAVRGIGQVDAASMLVGETQSATLSYSPALEGARGHFRDTHKKSRAEADAIRRAVLSWRTAEFARLGDMEEAARTASDAIAAAAGAGAWDDARFVNALKERARCAMELETLFEASPGELMERYAEAVTNDERGVGA